jgi:hypothetical protein
MILAANPYLGVGLYSIPEAARLIGVPAATLRRWLAGHSLVSPEMPKPGEPFFYREARRPGAELRPSPGGRTVPN